MAVFSNRSKFLATYHHQQNWSLPDTIIHYISKNPSSTKAYEKAVKTCKYFFVQNPILIVSRLYLEKNRNEWDIFLNDKLFFDLMTASCKIWITSFIEIRNSAINIYDKFFESIFVPKIYVCDVKRLHIYRHSIFFNDLLFLTSKCDDILLSEVTVMKANGSAVTLDEIVKAFPNLKGFRYDFGYNSQISTETASKLLEIPHFSNYENFSLCEIPEAFDINTFYDYMKKTMKTQFWLSFCNQLSEEYKNRLQEIINEILATHNREYYIPFIRFQGIDRASRNQLLKLYYSHN